MAAAEDLETVVRRCLGEAPFALKQLAAEARISYDVVRSWKSGRRRPSREGARRLALGLEEHANRLLELARGIRDGLEETRPARAGH
jgi:ribosome-binding protein aMBF1 (putative translation factor)